MQLLLQTQWTMDAKSARLLDMWWFGQLRSDMDTRQ